MKHSLECLIYLLIEGKKGVNGEVKSLKSMLIKIGYSNLRHACDFSSIFLSLLLIIEMFSIRLSEAKENRTKITSVTEV